MVTQDLPATYLAHHELASIIMMIIGSMIVMIVIIIKIIIAVKMCGAHCRQSAVQGSTAEGAGLCRGPQGAPPGVDRAVRFPERPRCGAAVCCSNSTERLSGNPAHD